MAYHLSQGLSTSLGSDQTLVDIRHSLAPFVIIYDENGSVWSTYVKDVPVLPKGVFQKVKQNGEQRFTWQPEADIRIASVVVPFHGKQSGFILAGRSLREVEKREDTLMIEVIVVWLSALFSTFAATGFLAMLIIKKK